MGTYSYEDFYETFGGPPEPGEAYPTLEQIDNLRKAEKESALLTSGVPPFSPDAPAGEGHSPSGVAPAGPSCDVCGAPSGAKHQHHCDLKGSVHDQQH